MTKRLWGALFPFVFAAVVWGAADTSLPLESPASAKNSDSPALTTAPDGTVWLSWLETADSGETIVKCAALDPRTRRWAEARTIAHGRDWVTTVFNAPQLVAQSRGRLTAVWSFAGSDGQRETETPRAFFSRSSDNGVTWNKPQPLTTESDDVDYVSLAALADDSLLAVWIDGRGRKGEAGPARLYSRRLGTAQPDTLLDERVCDCCRSSLTALSDGGALLTYRGRTAAEVRDILTARFRGDRWESPGPSTGDNWNIAGCPVNGPRVASTELCVSRVWYTAADNQPRVLADRSADGAAHFGEPLRLDLGHGAGRVDTLVFRDGTQLVVWLESAAGDTGAGIYARLVSPAGQPRPPLRIATLRDEAVGRVFPRIALLREFEGASAEVLVAFHRPGEKARVETWLVTFSR